jgi:hypothetical protein
VDRGEGGRPAGCVSHRRDDSLYRAREQRIRAREPAARGADSPVARRSPRAGRGGRQQPAAAADRRQVEVGKHARTRATAGRPPGDEVGNRPASVLQDGVGPNWTSTTYKTDGVTGAEQPTSGALLCRVVGYPNATAVEAVLDCAERQFADGRRGDRRLERTLQAASSDPGEPVSRQRGPRYLFQRGQPSPRRTPAVNCDHGGTCIALCQGNWKCKVHIRRRMDVGEPTFGLKSVARDEMTYAWLRNCCRDD